MPQPDFDPDRVCVHFTFCCHECTHFALIGLLYNLTLPTHTRGAHTVPGSVVLLYSYTLFQSLFTQGFPYVQKPPVIADQLFGAKH